MKKIMLLIIQLLLFEISFAQNHDSITCNSGESHQFDFWIGEWDIQQKILQSDGSWLESAAHTSVTSILNGCALEENWEGDVKFFWLGMEEVKPMKGFSIRYYNEKEKQWYIHWIDNLNLSLGKASIGYFKDGKGEFFSENISPKRKRITRITFSDISDNSVRWDLAISNDDGTEWTAIWIMDMSRAAE